MRGFLSVAPGVIWAAIIVGLTLGAIWLNEYLGSVVPNWLPALILTVIVPVLKVLAQGELPAGRAVDGVTMVRSKFSRWLW